MFSDLSALHEGGADTIALSWNWVSFPPVCEMSWVPAGTRLIVKFKEI